MPDPNITSVDFKRMSDRLLRGGVAPKHVRRTIRELREHQDDLREEAVRRGLTTVEAQRDAGSRLGSEQDLVREVLAKPELRSLASRWPWAIYGLGPVLAMCLAVVATVLIFAGGMSVGQILTGTRYIPPEWGRVLIDGMFFSVVHILPLLITIVVCREAFVRRTALVWPLVGVVVLCVIAAAFDISGTWPVTPEAEGILEIGFAYAAPFPISEENYIRTAVNLSFAMALFLWLRVRRAPQ